MNDLDTDKPPMAASEDGGATEPTNLPSAAEAKADGPKSSKPKKSRGRTADSPDVTLSKTLSYILRHGALKENLKIRPDGCVRLDDLLKRPKLKNSTIEDIARVVASNEKQRFTIIEEEQVDGTIVKFIRANQGHSLRVQRPDLKAVTDPSEIPKAVHGTFPKAWEAIAREGLKPMSRMHIHFAKGLIGEEGVVSGMRPDCEIFIYLDVEKCFQDKIEFFISSNGVILSEGLPDSQRIPPIYFKEVVHKSGAILYPLSKTN